MTYENLKRLYEHYCSCVATGEYEGKPLTQKALDNMKKAKADVEKNRPKFLLKYKEEHNQLSKPKKEEKKSDKK